MRMHNPPHPGSVLREYLGDLAVTTAAAHLRITRVTLSRVLNGKAGISAAMAIRLAAALGTTPEPWMNMQSQYDLWRARPGTAAGSAEVCARRLGPRKGGDSGTAADLSTGSCKQREVLGRLLRTPLQTSMPARQ
jgi:addiction module HigA family antidote